jgi:hypothetical protein
MKNNSTVKIVTTFAISLLAATNSINHAMEAGPAAPSTESLETPLLSQGSEKQIPESDVERLIEKMHDSQLTPDQTAGLYAVMATPPPPYAPPSAPELSYERPRALFMDGASTQSDSQSSCCSDEQCNTCCTESVYACTYAFVNALFGGNSHHCHDRRRR